MWRVLCISAVLPSWVPVVNQIGPTKQLGTATVNQMTLQLGKTRSDYDKIYKGLLHDVLLYFVDNHGPFQNAFDI